MKTALAPRPLRRAALAALLLVGSAAALPGCASRGPCERGLVTTLYLGRSIPGGGAVDDAAFRQFVEQEVAPRFAGFTLLQGTGWWTPPGAAEPKHEPSTVLQIVRCDEKGSEDAVIAVGRAYAERFRQESILRTDTRARIDW